MPDEPTRPTGARINPADICPRYAPDEGGRMCSHYFQAPDKTGMCTLPEFFTCIVYMASHPQRFKMPDGSGTTAP
jgi:hypothetical protein